MKIIHVISGLTKGGGERVAVELANKAVENGDEVTILAAWPVDPAFLQDKIHPAVTVKFVAPTRKKAYLKFVPFILKNKKWICNHDVLHCHLTFGSAFGAMVNILLKRMAGNKKPVIVETNHAVGMLVPKFNRWLHSRMSLQCDGMVLMAKDTYWNDFMINHPSLITTNIPNGIALLQPAKDEAAKNELLEKIGINKNCKYIIGTISMLRPDRNPLMYVPIFKEIHNEFGDEAHFILGGGGTEYDKIAKLVEEEGLSAHFHMTGLVSDPVPVFSVLDIYVSISMGEVAGISMIEAAMCKVPVIGIQLNGNYTRKDTDWVWADTDIKEVAKKIITLLKNTEERTRLTAGQYEYVTGHLSSDAMYHAYDSFYKQLLNA